MSDAHWGWPTSRCLNMHTTPLHCRYSPRRAPVSQFSIRCRRCRFSETKKRVGRTVHLRAREDAPRRARRFLVDCSVAPGAKLRPARGTLGCARVVVRKRSAVHQFGVGMAARCGVSLPARGSSRACASSPIALCARAKGGTCLYRNLGRLQSSVWQQSVPPAATTPRWCRLCAPRDWSLAGAGTPRLSLLGCR